MFFINNNESTFTKTIRTIKSYKIMHFVSTISYFILKYNPSLAHPINVYFGLGSRMFPTKIISFNYIIPDIYFGWFHAYIHDNNTYSTKFTTDIIFKKIYGKRHIIEEIIYSIPNNIKDNENLHNIKYIIKDNHTKNIIYHICKKNVNVYEIENNVFMDTI